MHNRQDIVSRTGAACTKGRFQCDKAMQFARVCAAAWGAAVPLEEEARVRDGPPREAMVGTEPLLQPAEEAPPACRRSLQDVRASAKREEGGTRNHTRWARGVLTPEGRVGEETSGAPRKRRIIIIKMD